MTDIPLANNERFISNPVVLKGLAPKGKNEKSVKDQNACPINRGPSKEPSTKTPSADTENKTRNRHRKRAEKRNLSKLKIDLVVNSLWTRFPDNHLFMHSVRQFFRPSQPVKYSVDLLTRFTLR